MSKKQIYLLVLAAAAVLAVWLWGLWARADARPRFPHSTLTITRHDGKAFVFRVEVARSESEQAYGLMFIRSMPADEGMIFPYDPPHEVAFWMKNTLIPLDMLFVRPDHAIGRIVTNARPQDLTPIDSMEPVSAVIELNGGEVERRGLAVGDIVDSPDLVIPQ